MSESRYDNPLFWPWKDRTRPGDWWEQRRCRNMNTEFFFPERSGNGGAQAAVNFCRQCPVMHECAEWATANGERWGVWGGVGEKGRRRIRRQSR